MFLSRRSLIAGMLLACSYASLTMSNSTSPQPTQLTIPWDYRAEIEAYFHAQIPELQQYPLIFTITQSHVAEVTGNTILSTTIKIDQIFEDDLVRAFYCQNKDEKIFTLPLTTVNVSAKDYIDFWTGILKHETGHVVHNDVKHRTALGRILAGSGLTAVIVASMYLKHKNYHFATSMLACCVVITTNRILTTSSLLAYCRSQEHAADCYAADRCSDNERRMMHLWLSSLAKSSDPLQTFFKYYFTAQHPLNKTRASIYTQTSLNQKGQ